MENPKHTRTHFNLQMHFLCFYYFYRMYKIWFEIQLNIFEQTSLQAFRYCTVTGLCYKTSTHRFWYQKLHSIYVSLWYVWGFSTWKLRTWHVEGTASCSITNVCKGSLSNPSRKSGSQSFFDFQQYYSPKTKVQQWLRHRSRDTQTNIALMERGSMDTWDLKNQKPVSFVYEWTMNCITDFTIDCHVTSVSLNLSEVLNSEGWVSDALSDCI